MQWTVPIYLLHLLLCRTHPSIAQDDLPPPIDSSTSGNYTINNCQRLHRSTDLHTLLPQFRDTLQAVLADLDHGTGSRHGFRTFFKSNAHLPLIKRVFRAIAQGENFTTTMTKASKPPILECASAEGLTSPQLDTFRMLCTPAGRKASHAASIPSHGTVLLCPGFWDAPDFPTEEDCVGVSGRVGRKQFVDNGWELRDTKFAVLVHELVHIYNPVDGAETRGTVEVYDVRDCAALGAEEGVGNAENWAVYAASVKSRCTRFPLSPIDSELRI